MAQENLSVVRFAVVVVLPITAQKGDTCVLLSNGHLYTHDGVGWVDNGASGGGGWGGNIDGGTPSTTPAVVAVDGGVP